MATDIVALYRAHRGLGRTQSILVVQPPPPTHALARSSVESAVQQAQSDARREGVHGASYERGVTDEFVEPVVLRGRPRLDPARDVAVVFNFRPDRVRQLTQRLLEATPTSSR
jgi:hypothetical protein